MGYTEKNAGRLWVYSDVVFPLIKFSKISVSSSVHTEHSRHVQPAKRNTRLHVLVAKSVSITVLRMSSLLTRHGNPPRAIRHFSVCNFKLCKARVNEKPHSCQPDPSCVESEHICLREDKNAAIGAGHFPFKERGRHLCLLRSISQLVGAGLSRPD